MNKVEIAKIVASTKKLAEESDLEYLKDLENAIKKDKKLDNPDDYIDLLLGIAEGQEDDVQAKIYSVVDFITEKWT